MKTLAAIFLLYLIALLSVGALLLKVWRFCCGRNIHDATPAPSPIPEIPDRQASIEANSYPSPCLSCGRKIDPVMCAGCPDVAMMKQGA